MQNVVDLVSALRVKGTPVSSSLICSVAKGVIVANDRSLLLENGGHIDVNIDWSRQVLYRFDTIGRKMSCRMATTAKIPIAPALLNETKFDSQRNASVAWNTGRSHHFTLIKHLCHTSVPETAPMQRKHPLTFLWLEREKKQITWNFRITMSGSFVPMQVIYKGPTSRCLPKVVDFPADFDATCTVNHWSNDSKAIQHL